MSVLAAVTGVLVLLVVAVLTVWCLSRARRLDRLHVRLDAARAGLAGALARRAEVALRIADSADSADSAGSTGCAACTSDGTAPGAADGGPGDGAAERLRRAARNALAQPAPTPDGRDPAGARERREAAENALTRAVTRALSTIDPDRVPPAQAVELADAAQLVVLARRVHNDAVRDTLVLRSRRLVRILRLHGTAPSPAYFEIADPVPAPDPAPDLEPEPAPEPAQPPPGTDVHSGGHTHAIRGAQISRVRTR
ncbi:hypothetical protein [Pseudonocardia phyllosphaerae]|uniref:hypothetical protein n=1 Tax=Pseudonocardia phyllosphaerae TaxID=3390502 RepID=UPI00397B95A6